MSVPHVIVPGIWNSGPEHWQTIWEQEWGSDAVRIAPTSWDEPEIGDWCAAIDRAVAASPAPPVLVAHSLGCLAVARWLADHDGGALDGEALDGGGLVAGAFLVAPPDPDGDDFPTVIRGFAAPTVAVTTPSVLVGSDDDPYCSLERAAAIAAGMGAALLRVGPLGHVNVAAGVGAWEQGRDMLAAFESDLPQP